MYDALGETEVTARPCNRKIVCIFLRLMPFEVLFHKPCRFCLLFSLLFLNSMFIQWKRPLHIIRPPSASDQFNPPSWQCPQSYHLTLTQSLPHFLFLSVAENSRKSFTLMRFHCVRSEGKVGWLSQVISQTQKGKKKPAYLLWHGPTLCKFWGKSPLLSHKTTLK